MSLVFICGLLNIYRLNDNDFCVNYLFYLCDLNPNHNILTIYIIQQKVVFLCILSIWKL